MGRRAVGGILAAVLALSCGSATAQIMDLLSVLQGRQAGLEQGPTTGPARAIGSAANGCLAGGQAMPQSGPGWEVLRPERNRYWGTPDLVTFLKDRASRTSQYGTLLIGDMSQPRGGRMPSGHGSHQTGIDADILFRLGNHPLTEKERAKPMMDSVLTPQADLRSNLWDDRQVNVLRLFASDSRVERIFVNPAIKVVLCRTVKGDRSWLRRLRPWWGHDEHFHVRLQCPLGDMDCVSGPPLPEGEGCGDELQSWMTSGAWNSKPTGGGDKPAPLAPMACRDILPHPK